MTRKTTAAALFATTALVVAACGGDDNNAYCDELHTLKDTLSFDDVDITDTKQTAELSTAFGGVVSVAPEGVKSDWRGVSDFFGRLADGDELADFSSDDAAAAEEAMNNVSTDMQDTCDLKI